ncbi:MAG: hypothetical protein HY296_06200 [Thaumarchaeota archaeon]|nr:hypothetical protein [Nitrososphaerota archaeon]
MQSVTGLLQITDRRPQGPSPTFDRAHLLLAFLTIGQSGTIGRQALAGRSGLGEGAIRTVLKRLREERYVEANASGCYLTRAGERVYADLTKKLSKVITIHKSQLTMGTSQASLAVRGGGRSVKSGIEQRDSAIKVGAKGATTYVIKSGRFTIPGGSPDCEKDFPNRSWATLRRELVPEDGDSVIVCGSEEETVARLGALSAALTLL